MVNKNAHADLMRVANLYAHLGTAQIIVQFPSTQTPKAKQLSKSDHQKIYGGAALLSIYQIVGGASWPKW